MQFGSQQDKEFGFQNARVAIFNSIEIPFSSQWNEYSWTTLIQIDIRNKFCNGSKLSNANKHIQNLSIIFDSYRRVKAEKNDKYSALKKLNISEKNFLLLFFSPFNTYFKIYEAKRLMFGFSTQRCSS